MKIQLLDQQIAFPPVHLALNEPNGLLAIGGDLSTARVIHAYHNGIFPWFNDNDPILWWSPDPRAVLFPDKLHLSRSLKRQLNKKPFTITHNQTFDAVITQCAAPRAQESETWITADMQQAYIKLHHAGYAHSIECWQHNKLVGGLYGVWIGAVFCAESMFHTVDNASKFALVHLVNMLKAHGGKLIDVQITSPHLVQMGAQEISRAEYLRLIKRYMSA